MKMLADFDKEGFKKEVITNVKTLFRKPIEEATPQQVFQAVSYAVKDDIIDRWIATHKEYEKKNVKTVYYLSMEFLMGRALGNNLINLTYYDAVKEALTNIAMQVAAMNPQYMSRSEISDEELAKIREITIDSALNDPASLPKPILKDIFAKVDFSDEDKAIYAEKAKKDGK